MQYFFAAKETRDCIEKQRKKDTPQGCDAVVLLAGNKLDLASNREVTTSEGQVLCSHIISVSMKKSNLVSGRKITVQRKKSVCRRAFGDKSNLMKRFERVAIAFVGEQHLPTNRLRGLVLLFGWLTMSSTKNVYGCHFLYMSES